MQQGYPEFPSSQGQFGGMYTDPTSGSQDSGEASSKSSENVQKLPEIVKKQEEAPNVDQNSSGANV